jgi:hypothetical protein
MDEMRGGASTLHRGLADRDAQPDHPATSWHSIRYVGFRFGWKTGSHILAKML